MKSPLNRVAEIGLLLAFGFMISSELGRVAAKAESKPATQRAPASQPAGATTRPTLKVGKDGFPAGHETPEGVACDLARAFINRDAKLFRETCIPPFGGGDNRKEYEDFLKQMEASIAAEIEKKEPSPGGPKEVKKLYAARHLSKDGPVSAGYALFDFEDVNFIDVGVLLQNGKQSLIRTLVIKKEGKWYVHPAPDTAPLLSAGLNDEPASKLDFTDKYDVKK